MAKKKKHQRAIWKEVVNSLIDNLVYADDAAAREIGKLWQWAFSHLEENPETFNALQNEDSLKLILEKFLGEIGTDLTGKDKARKGLVESVLYHSKAIEDIPIGISHEVLNALGAFGMFFTLGEQKAIDTPSKFPYTAALFTLQPAVFEDILKTKRIPEEQQKIIKIVAKYLPESSGAPYFERIEAAANIERWFGFDLVLLSSTDVYERGYTFYREASEGASTNTLTFSNTSGLWNPYERLGTREFARRYGINENKGLKYKDGYRATNFTDGILNNSLSCKRIYLFNEKTTWAAFMKARSAAKDVEKFDQDTNKFIKAVCSCIKSGLLYLVSVKNFDELEWPLYITRVSSGTIMFSHRQSGIDLSHAIWCGLGNQSRLQRVLFKVIKELSDFVPGVSIGKKTFQLLQPKLAKLVAIKGEETRQIVSENLSADQVLYKLTDNLGVKRELITPDGLRQQYQNYLNTQ